MLDVHSDTWWERALDDALTPTEARVWQAHLRECEECRIAWAALQQLESMLLTAPAPPALPEDFAARTVAQFQRRRQLQLTWGILSAIILAGLALWLAYLFLGPELLRIDSTVTAILAGRHLWLQSLNRLCLSLLNARGAFMSISLIGVILLGCLLTPNSVFAALAFVWFTRDKWGREQPLTIHTLA